ncbi:MAG: DUF2264 domain-containing protein [Arachnia sp.]
MEQNALGQATGPAERDRWTGFADRLLAALRPFASPNNARITPPGAEGGYGRAVDGLEGFARSLMIAGFRIAGERGQGVDDLIDFYSRGIAAGVDPSAPDRWVRPQEHAQAKVEAASLALVLDLTRPWIWDALTERTREQLVDYLAEIVGDTTYPRNNWLWFRIVVETFLRSVGGPWSQADIEADLALHDSFLRADGWISDGDERAFDQYTGWALHLYPALWPRMAGAAELAGGRTAADVARLDRFLLDARALVGADGSPLIQGRSLIYRFAAAAPFWAGVVSEVPSTSAGALRHAAGRIVGHFVDHGAPGDDGLLTMGWHHEWRPLAQSYSGPGSPYWAAKGLLGIMLPADHPVWTAPDEPLPVEQGDVLRALPAPGWVAHGTRADGIVRIVNHGTDHALPGAQVGDSPLYARIGYSTATSPLLDAVAWRRPLEQSVAVVDTAGRATHRAAMDLLDVRVDGEVGVAGSVSTAHWIAPDPAQVNHGSGIAGDVEPAGRLTVWSLVRGPWEVRLARLDQLPEGLDEAGLTLRFGGWPLAAANRDEIDGTETLTAHGLTSRLVPVLGRATASTHTHEEASPLGPVSVTPTLTFGLRAGEWVGALVELAGRPAGDDTPTVILTEDGPVLTAETTWPDGLVTSTHLTGTRGASDAPEADRDLT